MRAQEWWRGLKSTLQDWVQRRVEARAKELRREGDMLQRMDEDYMYRVWGSRPRSGDGGGGYSDGGDGA